MLRILFYFLSSIFQNIPKSINIEGRHLSVLLFQFVVVNALDEMLPIVHDGKENTHQPPDMSFLFYLRWGEGKTLLFLFLLQLFLWEVGLETSVVFSEEGPGFILPIFPQTFLELYRLRCGIWSQLSFNWAVVLFIDSQTLVDQRNVVEDGF